MLYVHCTCSVFANGHGPIAWFELLRQSGWVGGKGGGAVVGHQARDSRPLQLITGKRSRMCLSPDLIRFLLFVTSDH